MRASNDGQIGDGPAAPSGASGAPIEHQRDRSRNIWTATALAIVIAISVSAAAGWLVGVPFFQQPDENAHADYAFAIYDAGTLFRLARALPATNVTPQVRYLERASSFFRLRYDPRQRLASSYGTKGFFAHVDGDAPNRSGHTPRSGSTLPYAAFGYPVGFYVLEALAMGAGSHLFAGSLVAAFYGARSLGLACLAVSLIFTYLCFRRLRMTRVLAVLATAGVGCFPLTSWVSAYIQPDNLTFTIVTMILYLALCWKDLPVPTMPIALALSIGALALVKPLYAIAIWIPILLLVASRNFDSQRPRRHGLLSLLLTMLIPASALVAAHFATLSSALSVPPILSWDSAFPGRSSLLDNTSNLINHAALAAMDAFAIGPSFNGFWDSFGWNGRSFLAEGQSQRILGFTLSIISIQVTLLILLRQSAVFFHVYRIAAKRKTGRAIKVLGSDVMFNAYLAWTSVLICVFAVSQGRFWLQGRYWLPMLPATVALTIVYLPRIFKPRHRKLVRHIAAFAWLSYGAILSPVAFEAMHSTFYGVSLESPLRNSVALITSVKDHGRRVTEQDEGPFRRGPISIEGWTRPLCHACLITGVFLVVDGRHLIKAATGLANPMLALYLDDDGVKHSRFAVTIDRRYLSTGPHTLGIIVRLRGYPDDRWHNAYTLAIKA